jgi:hypothetical protein
MKNLVAAAVNYLYFLVAYGNREVNLQVRHDEVALLLGGGFCIICDL